MNYPKMQSSITIATLSIFGAKTKYKQTNKKKKKTLTGVRSRVRESLASQLM